MHLVKKADKLMASIWSSAAVVVYKLHNFTLLKKCHYFLDGLVRVEVDTALPDPTAALLVDAGDEGAADDIAVVNLLALVAEVGFMKLREAVLEDAGVVPLRPFNGLPRPMGPPPFDLAVDVVVIPVMLEDATVVLATLPSVTLKLLHSMMSIINRSRRSTSCIPV